VSLEGLSVRFASLARPGYQRVTSISNQADGLVAFMDSVITLPMRFNEMDFTGSAHFIIGSWPILKSDEFTPYALRYTIEIVNNRRPNSEVSMEDDSEERVSGTGK
jgi:hypothetical protein